MTENLDVSSGIYRTSAGGLAVDPALSINANGHPVRNEAAGKPADHDNWCLNSACGLIACCYMDALGKVHLKGTGTKRQNFEAFPTNYMKDFVAECTAKAGAYSLDTLWKNYRNPFVHQFAGDGAIWGRMGRTADYWFDYNGEVAINIDRLAAGTALGIQAFKTWCDAEVAAGNAKYEDFKDWLDKN
jgi:hypothetical protein